MHLYIEYMETISHVHRTLFQQINSYQMIDRLRCSVFSQAQTDPVQQEVRSRPDPVHTWRCAGGLQLQQTGW